MTTCLTCGRTIPRGPRCKSCQKAHKQKYSRQAGHPQERESWAGVVATGHVKCARCDEPIQQGQPWDLGHQLIGGPAPEHAHCNRAAGGRGVA